MTVRKAVEGLWQGLDNLEGMLGVGEKGEMIPGTVPEGSKGFERLMKGGSESEAARLLELKKEREIFLAGRSSPPLHSLRADARYPRADETWPPPSAP